MQVGVGTVSHCLSSFSDATIVSDITLIRWAVPADPPKHDRQRILRDEIRPLLSLTSFVSLGAEYYVGQYHDPAHGGPSEVRLTLVLPRDRADDARRIVAETLPRASSGCEIPSDRILQADCVWYRRALQCLTDIALDVLSSSEAPPVEEPPWFAVSEALIQTYVDSLAGTIAAQHVQ